MRFLKPLLFIIIFPLLILFTTQFVFGQSADEIKAKEDQIKELEAKVKDLQNQGKTLALQISVMNNQIKLTELRIDSTKQLIVKLGQDIDLLSGKIDSLEDRLKDVSEVLLNRIVVSYKVGNVEPVDMVFSSHGFGDFISRAKYIQVAQDHDRKLLFELEQTKINYNNQKDIFTTKQAQQEALKGQLEKLSIDLDQQKKDKERLLEVTKNDEKRYQELLAKSRAEFEAIQGIIAGKGQESKVGDVSEGQKIASIISGASCNSGGTHVHFIVSKNGATENPFSYLKSGVDFENCSGSSCGSSDGDSFNPSGSWNWPIEPKIKYNQGYGSTWATRNDPIIRQIYSFHNGIDISGSSLEVKAVKAGVLYRGSYAGSNGCSLRYVRVDHKDSDLDTFYLHINYL